MTGILIERIERFRVAAAGDTGNIVVYSGTCRGIVDRGAAETDMHVMVVESIKAPPFIDKLIGEFPLHLASLFRDPATVTEPFKGLFDLAAGISGLQYPFVQQIWPSGQEPSMQGWGSQEKKKKEVIVILLTFSKRTGALSWYYLSGYIESQGQDLFINVDWWHRSVNPQFEWLLTVAKTR